jgi:DNA-binding transcriptional LysR family regulator
MSLPQLNFRHLQAFYLVAKNRSFTRASEELHISQPTLSLQVQELEKHYNVTLLKRTKRSIELTDEGELVFSYAEKIFHLAREMENAIEDLGTMQSGMLRIGSGPLYAKYIMPDVIDFIQKNHPHIRVQLQTGPPGDILEKVIRFECHVGIVGRLPYPENVISKNIIKQKLYFITVDSDFGKKIYLKDLSDYPIILQQEGSAIRETVINAFKSKDILLNVHIESHSHEAIKTMVQNAMGGAFFPLYGIEGDLSENKFRSIDIMDDLYLFVDLIFMKERRKSRTVRTIISAISKYHL